MSTAAGAAAADRAAADRAAADRAAADASTDPRRPAPGRHDLLDPPEDRGATTIEDRVFEVMAVRIAGEEPAVGGTARRVLGVAVTGQDAERAPRVDATVAGEVVSLRVRLSVTYPAPVHAVTDRLRRQLIERIGELTGKRVGAVDVVVAALHRPGSSGRVVR